MPLSAEPGQPCVYCKRPCYRTEYRDYVDEGCSEFCATQTQKVLEAFLLMKAGDYGVFPCSECGCAVEDFDYEPGSWCSSCTPKRAKRIYGELLTEALPYLPPRLAERVRFELSGNVKPAPEATPRFDREEPV